ncbi:MAG: hypothetical protein RLY78_982 [Pseudomonadota bacterium]|jgi:thiamine biosynthesis lipoprotein|uniref:FAD:protein FMN transferase n=1 Tax=Pseudaquabacterium rugosum TaxID=2984194 RepID=A0ABU9B9R0_9BURK
MSLHHHHFQAMTTDCRLQFGDTDAATAAQLARRIEARTAALVRRYNLHDPASWLNRCVNRRSGRQVELDDESAQLLRAARAAAERSLGAFDITLATAREGLARADSLDEARAHLAASAPAMGLAAWRLSGRQLHLPDARTRLDLGGVVKEHAVDEALRLCRQAGLRSALVNFGGDVAVLGRRPDGSRWIAAVSDPLQPAQPKFALDLEDQSLTTSAHYARQRRLADGHRLSHIAQAAQGRSRWISASVIARDTLTCGFYSTALLVRDDFTLPAGVHAVVVDADGRVHRLTPDAAAPAATLPAPSSTSAAPAQPIDAPRSAAPCA